MTLTVSLTSSQVATLGEVARDAIEAESWTVRERLMLGDLHEGAEVEMVSGAVRLHRLASQLLALDMAYHQGPDSGGYEPGLELDSDDCPTCHGEEAVRYCKGDEGDDDA